jgi:hypothetical protein
MFPPAMHPEALDVIDQIISGRDAPEEFGNPTGTRFTAYVVLFSHLGR